MQRKTFVRTLLAVAACAATSFAAQAQTTQLTLGHGAAPGNPRHEAALKFGEVVKAKTSGRIDVLTNAVAFLILLLVSYVPATIIK